MSSESFMITDPPRLRVDTSIKEAMGLLFCSRVFSLPVVDADERFVGLFDVHQLMKLLLPRAVTMDHGLSDLAYVGDTDGTYDHLKRQLAEIGEHAVGDYLTTDTPVIHPDTSTVESLLHLYHHPSLVPVVDKESGRLLGITTCWDALTQVAEIRCPLNP